MTITATIIADSISPSGKRITTYELEYPRFIHAEFMTHRMFSRNAASSRAIPIAKAIRLIIENTARPTHWGKNQPGMSAREEHNELVGGNGTNVVGVTREEAWDFARNRAVKSAKDFEAAGYHKQIVNRLLEPFSHIKVVCTATEYDNFFWLREHPDAQPEIRELAVKMLEAARNSKPVQLQPGEWHVPYYKDGYWKPYTQKANVDDPQVGVGKTLDEALAISASCCAQVSYRVLDTSLEKAISIFERLVSAKPVHASPFEHQASPMAEDCVREDEQVLLMFAESDPQTDYITHVDRRGRFWSGNFMGWIQHRQMIPDNTCWRYDG